MLKLGKQILHTLVLLITGMALIGVNVHVLAKRNVAVVRGNGNFVKIVVMLLPVMIFIK